MPTQWLRVKQIFQEASELQGDERKKFLDSACGAGTTLRGEVEHLLALDERTDSVLPPDDETEPARPPVFSPGDVVAGRFEIHRLLGRGGMAEVYEAHDRELDSFVALKTILPELVHDPKMRERFRREILLARKVSHHNVCRIYDLAPDPTGRPDVLSFTMELIEGETLAAHFRRRGPLTPEDALPLIRQMAAGLDALHREGIIHRDFKPGNIILARTAAADLEVKLTDFGLARPDVPAGGGKGDLSGSREIIGTPRYMAPEQLTGRKISSATDVYALGLVLYEMVSGARPFEAVTFGENAVAKNAGPPPSLASRGVDVGPRWDNTILRCLVPDPKDRPASAAEVVAALEGAHDLQPLPEPAPWWKRLLRRPAVAIGLFFALLALCALLIRSLLVKPDMLDVAVLPFTVAGADPQLRATADGLMGAITQRLSQYERDNEELLVVPASEVRRRGVTDSTGAREAFSADYAILGRLLAQGDRLRLTVTVIDTTQMRQAGTDVIENRRANTLAIQDRAVASLTTLLDLSIEPELAAQLAGLNPAQPDAYEFFNQAQGYLVRQDRLDEIDNAIKLYHRAIEIDPDYALAYAGLSEAYWHKYNLSHDRQFATQAQSFSRLALRKNDQLPEVYVAVGRVQFLTGEYESATSSFQKAIDLDPRSAPAYEGLARTYEESGRIPEAQAAYQKLLNLRRGDWRAYKQLGFFYLGRSEFDLALDYFRRVANLQPDSAQAHLNLGLAYYRKGDTVQARREWEQSVDREPGSIAIANLGMLDMRQKDYGAAAARFQQAVKLNPNDFGSWGNLAAAYYWVGDARTRSTYEKAYQLALSELELNPRDEPLFSTLAHYAIGAGRRAEANQWLAKAMARDTRDVGELTRNAATCEKMGLRHEALEMLRRALIAGADFGDIEERPMHQELIRTPEYQQLKQNILRQREN